MASDLVFLINFLTPDELSTLKHQFDSLNIKYVFHGHGANSRYKSEFYEIKVLKEDYDRAKFLINKFRARNFIESRKCPKCKSLIHKPVDLGFFKRLFYWGTTLVQCEKCKTKYVI